MKAPIEECPHCGNSNSFYVKVYAHGPSQDRYLWGGGLDDNSDMHDGLKYDYGKFAYCNDCHKRIFKWEDGAE